MELLQPRISKADTAGQLPEVSVVILNWNGKAFLEKFLPSVLASTYRNLRIVLADNHSSDESVKYVKQFFPSIEIIENSSNDGFAKGYNSALQKINTDYYVLLNSDVEVSPGWIEPVIELMETDEAIAACQPKILSYSHKNYFEYAGAGGGWIDSLGYPFARGRVFDYCEEDKGQYQDASACFWASGAAMFVKADLYHRFGGFDEDHWAHWEEIDLCWRMKRAGYKVVVQPQGVARHVGGGTLEYLHPRKAYLNFRNSLFTLFKNEKTAKLLWLSPLRLLLDGAAAAMFLKQKHFKHITAILKAHFHFYAAIPSLLHKRKKYAQIIEKERIGAENTAGILRGSIVWAYYIGKKKYFKDLFSKKASVVVGDDDEDEGES